MPLYWNTNQIPELKGLDPKARLALVQPVLGAVWRRWQVWLPIATQIVCAFAFIFFGPQFPNRTLVVIVVAYVTIKIAFLPYHHFLALELRRAAGK